MFLVMNISLTRCNLQRPIWLAVSWWRDLAGALQYGEHLAPAASKAQRG